MVMAKVRALELISSSSAFLITLRAWAFQNDGGGECVVIDFSLSLLPLVRLKGNLGVVELSRLKGRQRQIRRKSGNQSRLMTPVKKFPQDIDEAIRYGSISSREGFKKAPDLWLLHSEPRGEART